MMCSRTGSLRTDSEEELGEEDDKEEEEEEEEEGNDDDEEGNDDAAQESPNPPNPLPSSSTSFEEGRSPSQLRLTSATG